MPTQTKKQKAAAKKLKEAAAKKKAAEVKAAAAAKADTSWQDSTYLTEQKNYKRVESDFGAEQLRKKGEIGQYYGTEAQAAKKEAVTKTTQKVKTPAVLAKKKFDKKEQAAYRKLKKTNPTKAETYKKTASATFRTRKAAVLGKKTTENVYDIKKQLLGREEVKEKKQTGETKVYAKKKFDKVERKKYRGLKAAGKKKKAVKYKTKVGSTLRLKKKTPVYSQVGTGKFKDLYKTTKTQRFKTTAAAKPATEGLYQRELRETRKKDISDIANDYAARGVIHSGLYAKKRGDYEKEFGKQMSEYGRKKTSAYQQTTQEGKNFQTEQALAKETSRLNAVRRKAARTGTFLT